MARPLLPPATIIDGRSLYTAADMRAYYDLALTPTCDELNYSDVFDTKPEQTEDIDNLMKIFGMKKWMNKLKN